MSTRMQAGAPTQGDNTPNGTNGSTPASSLDDVLKELGLKQQGLKSQIERGKSTLASDTTEQQQLKRQATELERAAGGLGKARTDAAAAIYDADKALQEVEHLIDELEDDVKTEIRDNVDAIEIGVSEGKQKVDTQWYDLDQARIRLGLEDAVTARKGAYDRAAASLVGLPAEMIVLVATMRKTITEMQAAAVASQPRKVFVLSVVLERQKDDLDALRHPDREKDLVAAFNAALDDFASARTDFDDTQGVAIDEAAALDQFKENWEVLKKGRKDKIEQLYIAPPDDADAAYAEAPVTEEEEGA